MTDHAAEMYKRGIAMGGRGDGKSAKEVVAGGGYVPGAVGKVKVDKRPVTDKELESAHDRIRHMVAMNFGGFRKAFRMIDFDGSGKIEPSEVREPPLSAHAHAQK